MTELGRIRAQKTASCPVGGIAYRAWTSGHALSVELPDIDNALTSEASAAPQRAPLYEQSDRSPVVGFVAHP